MNENAKKWVEALRSGEFKQTKDELQDTEGLCCLGVACVVYERETGQTLERTGGGMLGPHESDGCLDGPYERVKDWLGLRTPNGYNSKNGSLVRLNDNGTPFENIADIIESEPEGLFVE